MGTVIPAPSSSPSHPPRDVDTEIRDSLKRLPRMRLVSDMKINLWHALFLIIFIGGFVAAIVWTISEDLLLNRR